MSKHIKSNCCQLLRQTAAVKLAAGYGVLRCSIIALDSLSAHPKDDVAVL